MHQPFHINPYSCSGPQNSPYIIQWWGHIDIILLGISLIAVIYSARTTAKQWVGYALWTSWALLMVTMFNEKKAIIHLPEIINYTPAFLLIFFHLYNRKHCQCGDEKCCLDEKSNSYICLTTGIEISPMIKSENNKGILRSNGMAEISAL